MREKMPDYTPTAFEIAERVQEAHPQPEVPLPCDHDLLNNSTGIVEMHVDLDYEWGRLIRMHNTPKHRTEWDKGEHLKYLGQYIAVFNHTCSHREVEWAPPEVCEAGQPEVHRWYVEWFHERIEDRRSRERRVIPGLSKSPS